MTDDAGRPITPALHHWLWLRLLCNKDLSRLLIIAPPESAKTTWLTAYISANIALFPERPRIYAGATGPVATKRSIAIRNIVTSPRFGELFPEVGRAQGMSFEAHEWSVAPQGRPHPGRIHPTLSAYGTDGGITGARAAEAVGDDILYESNTRTAYQRELVWSWLHNSFLSRVVARTGRALIIGTAWHHDDAYARLRRDGTWAVCHIPMLSEANEVYATIHYPAGYEGERLGEAMAEAEAEELEPA